MRRFVWLPVCLFALPPAMASSPAPPPLPDARPPIAVEEILIRADSDERFVEGLTRRALSPDPADRLSPQLEAISVSVDNQMLALNPDEMRRLPVTRLESLDRHWKFVARRFERWEVELQQALAPYASEAARLTRSRADWEATRSIIGADNIPAALAQRMDAIIADLVQADQLLSVPLARQIELRKRANWVHARVLSGQESVAAAIADIDNRLLLRGVAPLWDVSAEEGERGGLATLAPGFEIEARSAREYGAAQSGNQRALWLFLALMLPLLLSLSFRNRAAKSAGDAPAAQTRVLNRPLSAWILLGMMGVLGFERDAPLMVHHAAMLLAIVPVLRLLPPRSRRFLRLWPYAVAALYLLAGLGYLIATNAFLYRIFLIFLTVAALAITLLMLWRTRQLTEGAFFGRVRKGVRAAGWSSVVLLAISLVSNVFGNVSLAEMLTDAVIESGYLALMLYAGVTVATALLQMLLSGFAGTGFMRRHGSPLLALLMRTVTLAGIAGWLVFTMQSFRILRPTYTFLKSVLSREFVFGEISISLGSILIFGVSVLIAFWVARVVRLLLRDEVLSRMSLARGVGNSVASLTYYAMIILGWVLALSAAGFRAQQLVLVFGALGVGIGFGLQGVVANFVSGLILMFERPIQLGDVVEIGGAAGRVLTIGVRATTISTADGASVIVPNGALLSGNLINWTLLDQSRRFDMNVRVAYGSNSAQVVELLRVTASETPGVASEPAPAVQFVGLGESSLEFVVQAWTNDFDGWGKIRSDLVTRVYAALENAGIRVPFAQTDLHLRSVSAEAGSVLKGSPVD